ncbi:cell division protein FtsZ [Temperatibacter marinus]|uniref:Cell division protein FtsZ n=1 Tax=Temperatibacter marinus TaxID=1456591 RepID=A0AA52H893_9PROT|nr:cell division protein FtsZ [Temperatibacter marinus]WND01599.1 cell division protein FtsZ [Temperatibacter marinus]
MAFDFENTELTELTPKIAVIGVGGAGCNAVNNMIAADLQGVDFIVANTDAQSLAASKSENRIQLGVEITQGLGAGAMPKVGAAAAEETIETIDSMLEGCHMAFVTAGMGGGTGTGAAPVIARRAREKGILTVGVCTKPFQFEGGRRMKVAEAGMKELAENVDTLIVIPNQNLFHVADAKTTFADAFRMADDVLHSGVRSITDLMVMDGLINLDFADVRTVMNEMGKAMMGTGEAEGEDRAMVAASNAISNQLLEEANLRGARGVIINVTGGMDMTLYEVDEAVNMVREQVDPDALIVFGSAFNMDMEGRLRVSVVATGIDGSGVRPAPVPVREEDEVAVIQGAADLKEAVQDMPAAEDIEGSEAEAPSAPSPETAVEKRLEEEQKSAQDELEAKAVEAAVDGAFIAEQPKHPKAVLQPDHGQRANVFQEAAYENTTTEMPEEEQGVEQAPPQDTPIEGTVEAEPEPAKQSLFKMMTAGLRSSQPANEFREEAQEPTVQTPSRVPGGDAQSLGGVDAEDRTVKKKDPRDQLEIPSFLKRQENQ